jgi:hypothetical protein
MRRAAPVVVVLTVAALLLLVGAPAFAAIVFAVLLGVIVLIGVAVARHVPRWRRRDPLARVSWLVSLIVSAVITVPQLALAHYRHAVAGVIGGVLWWLVLALVLRFVIFLADYFRRRVNDRATVN